MRTHALVLVIGAALSACSHDRDRERATLGTFEEAFSIVNKNCYATNRELEWRYHREPGAMPNAYETPKPTYECTISRIEQLLNVSGRTLLNWEKWKKCPCHNLVTLHRATNGSDARLLQVRIDRCPLHVHDEIVDDIAVLLRPFLAAPDQDELAPWDRKPAPDVEAQLRKDLYEPGRHANPAVVRSDAGTISTLRIYNDRVVEIEWSRDACRKPDGSVELQPTESYFIALRPREKRDAEHVTADKEPRVTRAPKCP